MRRRKMADSEEWFVGEDGCLSVGKPTDSVTYHSTLNTILVATKEPAVKVLDVTSGLVLQSLDLSACRPGLIKCQYLPGRDKALFTDGYAVGVRKDLNGILLLDTALQTPISCTEDLVRVELSLPEATHLFKCLMGADLPGVDYVEDVLRELEKEIEVVQQATKGNHKIAKWATVCLQLPHCALKTVCSNLVMELKRQHQHVPGLPIAAAITDRLSYLLPTALQDIGVGPIDRSLMYSEAARRHTFIKWPHMNYKWALPDAMAQAGFYHQPSSSGDDRAMCFTCNVCLVCWEPTDEPWSEHERHYPTCPFVKGEYTQNVPMAVTYATEPAIQHAGKGSAEKVKIECVSTTSSEDFVATSSLHGNVVLWNVSKQLKKHIQFNIDPWEPVVAVKTGCQVWRYDDVSQRLPQPRGAWPEHPQQTFIQPSQESTDSVKVESPQQQQQQPPSPTVKPAEESSLSDDNKSKAEIIQVTEAWKQKGTVSSEIVEIPLDDVEPVQRETFHRCRPSQDVLVSALCVLGPPSHMVNQEAGAAAAPSNPSESSSMRPCLVSGVAIRRNMLTVNDAQLQALVSGRGGSSGGCSKDEQASEVQAMNQVNQALSGDSTPHIISEESNSPSSTPYSLLDCLIAEKQNPFVPYLLVHDICKPKKGLTPWRSAEKADNKQPGQPGPNGVSGQTSSVSLSSGTKVSPPLVSAVHFYIPPIMEMEEEDPDVQIVGVTLPFSDTMIKFNGTPSLVPPKGSNSNNNVTAFNQGSSESKSNSSIPAGSNNTGGHTVDTLPPFPIRKEGRVVQCLELPVQVTTDQYISSITPTLDGCHVVVNTAPKCLHQNISCVDSVSATATSSLSPTGHNSVVDKTSEPSTRLQENNTEEECDRKPVSMDYSDSESSCVLGSTDVAMSDSVVNMNDGGTARGGCVLIYSINPELDLVLLDERPIRTCVIEKIEDTITSLLMLPREISQSPDEEDLTSRCDPSKDGRSTYGCGDPEGQMAVTTHHGDIRILRLPDCKVLATIEAPDRDKFVSVTYCTGMDRLCACTKEGKLHFYMVGPRGGLSQEVDSLLPGQSSPVRGPASGSREEPMDTTSIDHLTRTDDLLVCQPLTMDVMLLLHELTQFESLMPRFSATVPPCWNEIQQEQQQRRHPQHLQQQGESMQHTRTWRLQTDSTSYDEHLFELVLHRTCSMGHVDVKFQLHPLCTTPPNIQVTLLKQNISNIGRHANSQSYTYSENAASSSSDVDSKIDFNIQAQDLSNPPSMNSAAQNSPFSVATSSTTNVQHHAQTFKAPVINNVLDPHFLKRYSAEILCGPVDLGSHVDLSGHSGVLSLTSPQLLKVKSRSFLLHIKALSTGKDEERKEGGSSNNNKNRATNTSSSATSSNVGVEKTKEKPGLKSLLSGTSGVSKQKLDSVKGCDWLQEISVTVRRSKRTAIPRDRVQRLALVENVSFHDQLLVAACGQDDKLSASTSVEDRQGLALDILAWIAALQMNDPTHRVGQSCIVLTLQSNLKGLVKACFIESGRSVAHKCAKFISLCIEFSKNIPDPNVAPAFNFALLHGLLECVSLMPCMHSAGALHWYFTLLNRVKCMDIALTGQKCADMLSHVARHYHERTNPLHSLLKARFGLYGAPLDPVLFDVGPPHLVKTGASPASTPNSTSLCGTSAAAATATTTSTATATTVGHDEVDLRDLLSINASEKTGRSQMNHIQQHTCGLLEVEPLHFVCHATSDGTRMERMDAGSSGPAVSAANTGLSGTINFGEALPSATAAGAALASLSTAMASAEQQLQLLQQKQLQLAKLQQQKQKLEQKLAENKNVMTANAASTSSGLATSNFVPYSSELMPPTPKTTPLFMTPPVTPPNENYMQLYNQLLEAADPGKPPIWKPVGMVNQLPSNKAGSSKPETSQQKLPLPQTQHLLQAPPPQVLVIERMPSGARRFVVLDFGKPVLLTDVIVPACGDLASLSIDTWVQGEEVDGQRLVVSSDIGMRSLIMNDLMPPPVCRYLKVTTIGRYSGSTTRSRIPIGSFYGHSTILPWECEEGQLAVLSATSGSNMSSVALDQSQILSQLGMFVALQEDIQCRYSLACNRLTSLLSAIDMPNSNNSHTKYYLKKGKKNEEESKIHQAYQDCVQLQLQLNLAQRAIERLQRALGVRPPAIPANQSGLALLRQSSTDKLRSLAEQLLDTLLSMTHPTPTIPQLPLSLYASLTPPSAEALFHHMCISGTRRMQIHAGVLLVRVCGSQNWWGDFLGNIFQEYFASEQPEIFPQDRVFVLLTALGQKSLTGACASDVLESILALLAKLLSPLLSSSAYGLNSASLDLCLIGWLLLFLSCNLDNTNLGGNLGDDDKTKENNGSSSSRWDFIQGEASMQSSRLNNRASSSKLYRRKLQKRLMYHKQQLLDLQAAKKSFLTSQMEKSAFIGKEAETLMKQQEQLFKKQLKQYSSKHFKDIMQIRRTDGELLKKLPKDGAGSSLQDGSDGEGETHVTIVREKCIPVVRGLIALLLSMDFTCNVDLFLITCKVVARLTNVTRPAVVLSEVMSQTELERLILLCCNLEYNHGNITWGGAWAGHAITCLLQDVLDGERLYPPSPMYTEGVTDDEISAAMMDTDTSLQNSISLPAMETESSSSSETPAPELSASGKDENYKFDKESSLIVDMILDDEEYDDETNVKLQEYIMGEAMQPPPPDKIYQIVQSITGANKGTGTINWGAPAGVFEADDKKHKLESWKNKLASYMASKSSVVPQGISTAMDARLEGSLDLAAELRLKVMVSLETDSVQNAVCAPLPPPIAGLARSFSHPPQPPTTDDEQLSEANLFNNSIQTQVVPSHEMLSVCFNNLFAQLPLQRVNIDALLLAWLTLNDDNSQEDSTQISFDQSKVPSIPLSAQSVTSLLATLAWSPNVPVRTWVFAFQVLTLLTNLRCPSHSATATPTSSTAPTTSTSTASSDKWLATVMVADSNMMMVLIKFLSGSSLHGPVISSHQYTQVGPTATRAFQEFLARLHLRCAEDSENHLKELMLKLVYTLAAERGAFHNGLGPLDVQCKLLDHMLEQTYDHVDVSNAISVIDSLAVLVHQHIIGQEKVICRSSSETGISARSCFGGPFASMLRTGDTRAVMGDANRDMLMCQLLKLVNILVQITLPGRNSGAGGSGGGGGSSGHRRSTGTYGDLATDMVGGDHLSSDSPMTDASKINQSLASASPLVTSTPEVPPKSDEEKGSETDEQKRETAANASANLGAAQGKNKSRSCSHYADVLHPEAEAKEVTLSDVVLSHPQIMRHLVQALSCCNSNTMAMILGSSGLQGNMHDAFTGIDPLSVGDGIFQILCTLNKRATDLSLLLKPLLDYLASGFHGMRTAGICRLSEPLLWFILRVLDCEWAIHSFLTMGGVEVICSNLVSSNRKVINVSPSLISTIMQYLGNSKGGYSVAKRSTDTDTGDGLQNFAPLGTITSTSPTAGPADMLLQASPPHRRARSAAWSYHFYPDEAWVDLTITLPCAIQLKEVHIQPHLTSLATCPAAVSVEASRDGSMMIPVCAPKLTSGLTLIKLQLLKSEVVTAVTIRLHKPRDSTTIGLSQIMLLGCTAFGDTGSLRLSNVFLPTEDYVSRTSIGWLRLLHHCLTQSYGVADEVAAAAAPTPNLLVTCTALLVSPSAALYATSIEAVLLKIGLHSTHMGLALIDNLLRNYSIATDEAGGSLPLHGKVNGMANDSTIDILIQLGMIQDGGTANRIKALIHWLADSARMALQKSRSGYLSSSHSMFRRRHATSDLPTPAPAHIYCIASILWHSREQAVTYDLESLITQDILSLMYEWLTILPVDSSLKKAVDTVICALCYIHPEYFCALLEWMGVAVNLDLSTASMAMAITDDRKDSTQHHYRLPQPSQNRESMTDDSKEASNARNFSPNLPIPGLPLGSHGINMDIQPFSQEEFGHVVLDESRLLTLAMACQSPQALQILLTSGLPIVLCQGLFEYCTREMIRHTDTVSTHLEVFTDVKSTSASSNTSASVSADGSANVSASASANASASSSLGGSPRSTHAMGHTAYRGRTSSESSHSERGLSITADLVAPVMKFLAEVSKECVMQEWLGSPEGSVFWPALLHLLCNTPAQTTPPPIHHTLNNHKHKMMTSQQRASIETATVNFFTNVISCHSENQHLFANVLCDVIRGQGASAQGVSYGSCALSGFTRRLFLQVLLEDEKVLVSFRSSSQLYKGLSAALASLIQHPRCGAGHKYRAMYISLHSTCGEILAKVSDTPSLTAQILEEKDADRKASDEKKDTSELGLEVVDQISAAAGLQAKEKREKKTMTPPRPPSRRGHRPPDLAGSMHVFVLSLYHNMLPGQPLPADLTLSQLLVLLTERGLQPGQAMLNFSMKLQARKVANNKGDKRMRTDDDMFLDGEDHDIKAIPEAVLIDTPSFPSALQVFAGVGGLALLAEHLPLLYPEVTRQVTPPTVTNDNNNTAGPGNDWVTVESTEDIYEEIYEPMPPSQPSQSSKQSPQTLPTIPPHSLVAFGLFLRLPGYAEVLLKERKRAQCLLRLVLGVTDDGEGGHILTSPIAGALPTLPFHVLKSLFDSTPLTTDDGVLLRRMTLEIGAVHLVLACLSVLSHHAPRAPIPGFHQEVRLKIILAATQAASTLSNNTPPKVGEDKGQSYWAKGTGFGTGSTTSSWDAEQAFIRQRSEEEHVTCLLQVLSSYINPGGDSSQDSEIPNIGRDEATDNTCLPTVLPELLSQSCLVPAISSYLRNDSVLDMARHVPLYRGLLELLRGMAACSILVPLLLPLSGDDDSTSSIGLLLDKMKTCVDTYASRLKTNKSKAIPGGSKNKQEEEETEGLALLIPDIQGTACIVHAATSRMRERHSLDAVDTADTEPQGAAKSDHSQEERYIEIMKALQFDTYEMVVEEDNSLRFMVSHHYESNVKAAGDVNNASRARRLAQEAVTLSTSLPLAHSSSVFVRCDEDRLDVMKVLITGPSDTPYANGCFEFDVYFPQDYPNSPPLINLETTGNHTVRFNPNLYNDGKVCLSVLNTWHGRPEEKWNPQTSSFLQVLVSIQSLILVSEPYFNEPGYERSRGSPSGTASSREYDANIRQATVKWAMLEQLRYPSACFRDVTERHFWLKRHEISAQIEEWISELEAGSSDKRTGRAISHSCVALKRHYNQLKEELTKMKAPEGVEDDEDNTDPAHSFGAENMEALTHSHTDSDLSEKSPSTDSNPNLGKPGYDDSEVPHAGKDIPPTSGMMMMNHMDAVESMANDMMEPVMMNSTGDTSAPNSLSEMDDDLPYYL